MGALAAIALNLAFSGTAAASEGAHWAVRSQATPSVFSEAANAPCEASSGDRYGACDRFVISAVNVGGQASAGPVEISDKLPAGATLVAIERVIVSSEEKEGKISYFPLLNCEAALTPHCTTSEPVPVGGEIAATVDVTVNATSGPLANEATLSVNGTPVATSGEAGQPPSVPGALGEGAAKSPLEAFGFNLYGEASRAASAAGTHAGAALATLAFGTEIAHAGSEYGVVDAEAPRATSVDLPNGLVGNPRATPRLCSQAELNAAKRNGVECPAESQVGYALVTTSFGADYGIQRLPLYNMVPEAGYPASFGFFLLQAAVYLNTRVVPTPSGYRIAVSTTGMPHSEDDQLPGVQIFLFGDPGEQDGVGKATPPLFTSPTRCDAEVGTATAEETTWAKPTTVNTSAATVFDASPSETLSGCGFLSFAPQLKVEPDETKTVDTPSGYEVTLTIPQGAGNQNVAAADLRDATVTLPEGVSLSPAAANGLEGCTAQQIGMLKTVIGEDGQPHPAAGECPNASRLGTVQIVTPLLEKPLEGHVYLAQPGCGGAGQPACTEESAKDGQLYGIYLEAAGSGVIIKLRGNVAVNPKTGQIVTSFRENPQLPFETLTLRLHGGQRAPLANPQTCGQNAFTSVLEPWGGAAATPAGRFETSGCVSPMPLAPGFEAGTSVPAAGGFSPFTMTIKRKDGEQDLAGVRITLPPGISGMISKVPLCPAAQANAGTCSAASQIGVAHVAAGAGSEPYWLEGPVYLTANDEGAPFGLSIVVPAKAGPFNLGDVVVRARIEVNPHNAQVTVQSNPLPQIRDGVPFRIKEINVTVSRPDFMFNPTSCGKTQVTGAISGDMPNGTPGATAAVSSPFATAGCRGLPFKPRFSALIHADHSRKDGEYLHVVLRSKFGDANIGKVHVQLPGKLPSRLETLKHACTEAQFAANPAGCPAESFVGHATAHTPVLPVPLRGPAVFVSHAGKGFPNLDLVMQGDGVHITLVGNTHINEKSEVTTSTFNSVPDVPISRFDLVLPAGPHSALAGNGNMCRKHLYMPTTLTGQNGAVVSHKTRIMVEGCKAEIEVRGHRARHDKATIFVHVPSAGKLIANGKGLHRTVKRIRKHGGRVGITIHLGRHDRHVLARKPHERINAKIDLRFKPRHGKTLHAHLKVLIG